MSDALVKELFQAALAGADYSSRTRLAVSPEEYEQLRVYFFRRDGRFHGRILNVPLIVEDEPPEQFVEIVTGEFK